MKWKIGTTEKHFTQTSTCRSCPRSQVGLKLWIKSFLSSCQMTVKSYMYTVKVMFGYMDIKYILEKTFPTVSFIGTQTIQHA